MESKDLELLEKNGIETPYFSLNGLATYARLVDVYDGDTLTCVIPVPGMGCYKFNIRLNGIDTAEMKDKNLNIKNKAYLARNAVLEYLCKSWRVDDISCSRNVIKQFLRENTVIIWIECLEFEKYGRLLAKISPDKDKPSVSDVLLDRNLAYKYEGGTKSRTLSD